MENNNEFYTVRGYQLLKKNKKMLTSSMEDYLEMIYRNSLEEGYMRISTLSELLNVRPSSATKMVQRLAAIGLVDYKRYGIIFLTESGKEIGKFLLNRHNIVEKFLKTIGIAENLLKETELIEHNVSVNTLQNIYLLNKFFDANPDIISKFEDFKEKSNIENMFD
ncbi:MAG TPA: DtxR family transcriptional regulator [Clostridiaceae bacterium]|nr:DtxR family transcriptional regulator [Clostridiaceae bacterium]